MTSNNEPEDLAKTGTRGAAATLAGQGLKASLQFISIVTLARILSPSEFGDVAIVMAIIGIASILTDFGLSLAAVQARTLSRMEENTLYWVNTLLGILCFLFILLTATTIAGFYNLSRIEPIAQSLSVVFLLSSVSVQHRVKLIRNARFGLLAVGEVVSQFLGLIAALCFAIAGFGVWSLVAQQITAAAAAWIYMWFASGWSPGPPWKLTSIRRFVNYSLGTVGTQVMNYASVNLPSVAIGRSLGPSDAGVYNRAFQLFVAPMQQLASPLTRVALAVLSRSWGTDNFARQVLSLQRTLVYSLGVFLAYILVCSNQIISILLGAKWSDVGPVLAILCVGGIFQVIGYAYYWAFLASGRTSVLLLCEIPGRLVMIFGVLVCVHWGLQPVAWCITAGLIFISVSSAAFGLPRIGVSLRQILISIRRPASIVVSYLILCSVFRSVDLFSRSGSLVTLGLNLAALILVFVVSLSASGFREEYRSILGLLRSSARKS